MLEVGECVTALVLAKVPEVAPFETAQIRFICLRHMGAKQRTQIRLTVAKVDAERNLLYVQGAVPGPMRGIVTVRKEGT